MLKNYLSIALRTLRRHRGYAFINIFGLAVGMACCLLMLIYVQDERSYDRFHEKADRTYRVVEDIQAGGRLSRTAHSPAPLAPALQADFPVVERAVRLYPFSGLVSRDAGATYQEDGILFVDSTFFDVFSFPLRRGEAATALEEPFSLVLTEAAAARYFGGRDPLGQVLRVRDDEGTYDFTVTGVVAPLPHNSHFGFDFLASLSSLRTIMPWYDHWLHPPMYTYITLPPGQEAEALAAQLPAFARKHLGPDADARSFHLQALTDIRLHSNRENEIAPTSDVAYIYLFSILAVFILLIACINFMNLATARSARRSREVGVRKVMGARRSQLIRQFMSESTVLAALALVLALVLIEALLPVFNGLAGKSLSEGAFARWEVVLTLGGLVLLVGALAGSYPALYLSAFSPASVFKGPTRRGNAAAALRKGLVVFQFVVSIGLILGTVVIRDQLDFLRNERLGFDKEHVVVVPLREQADQFNAATLKQAWLRNPQVLQVTASSGVPGKPGGLHDFLVVPEDNRRDSLELMTLTVDHDFAEAFGLEVVDGRDFSEDFATDAAEGFLLNESAARKLGWGDPVGKRLTLRYYLDGAVEKTGTVVGVVRDFQYHSLRRAIDPTVLHILPGTYYNDFVSVRIRPESVADALDALGTVWKAFNPDRPFEYTFLDEEFDRLYRAEERLGRVFSVFAAITILVACLGLFGLAAFTAEQRTKEVGVRKVMGASVPQIVALLAAAFLRLIGIAFVVAMPVAYLVMQKWLDNFAVRIDIGAGTVAFTAFVVLLIALATVSFQSIKAARANPVDALRYE